jgi:Peptidase C39 family
LIASFLRPLVAVAVLLTAAGPIHAAPGQAYVAALHLLDVPYLPQSELLCGGAAAAMVLRYWGATNIYAESFADLVDPAAGGIRGDDLLAAVRSREWSAESFRGDRATIQEALRARHPVIVLIEDRPGRFHYVVVVGWSAERVIVHDPARAPFRVIAADAFEASWKASNYWAVAPVPLNATTMEPPAAAPESAIGPVVRPNSDAPCAGMVDEGVRLGGGGGGCGG